MIIRRALLGLIVVLLAALAIGIPSSAPKAQIIPMAFWQSGSTYATNGTALRFRASNNACLTRTMTGSGSTWSLSMWVKSTSTAPTGDLFNSVQTTGSGQQGGLGFSNGSGYLTFYSYHPTPGYQTRKIMSNVLRDPTAWYHLVTVWDTNNAVAEDRMRMYVNGVRVTSFSTNTVPGSAGMGHQVINNGFGIGIGCQNRNTGTLIYPFDGYIADVKYVDSQALEPTAFGQLTNGVWVPRTYAGTYNSSSFWLKFTEAGQTTASNAGFGKDFWNSNYWVTNGISSTAGATYDGVLDSPSVDTGLDNYATMNPLMSSSSSIPITDGNLTVTNGNTASSWYGVGSTMAANAGKWYYELSYSGAGSLAAAFVGLGEPSIPMDSDVSDSLSQTIGWYLRNDSGAVGEASMNFGTSASFASGADAPSSGTVKFAIDMDAGKMWIGRDAAWFGGGNPSSNTSPTVTFTPGRTLMPLMMPCCVTNVGTITYQFNFGQRDFAYAQPSGFNSWNTNNLPAPAAANPKDYFKILTYTGNGAALTLGEPVKQTSPVSLTNSLRFKSASSPYLSRVGTAGSRQKWTWSGWVKRTQIGTAYGCLISSGFSGYSTAVCFDNLDRLSAYVADGSSTTAYITTTPTWRDTSAWYHIVWSVDTTQATAADRNRLFINGQQITTLAVANYPTLNFNADMNNSNTYLIGKNTVASPNPFDGYMADMYYVDGQSLTPSSFGQADAEGDWVPKAYSGTYGTNGFHLDFSDNTNLGKDSAGSNNWTVSNINSDAVNPFVFKPTGFQVGSSSLISTNTNNYASWNWKKGTTPGFDVVSYTGTLTSSGSTSVNHGLGTTPAMIISKSTTQMALMLVTGSSGINRWEPINF